MTNVTYTSIEAHTKAIHSGRKQSTRERILLYIEAVGPRTRNELSVELQIRINHITGPVRVCIDSGLLYVLDERRYDKYNTNQKAEVLDIVRPEPHQRSFQWPT